VSTGDVHTLAGAYAMDALTGPDRDRFERHLAGCAECAQEIAGLLETTALLGTAAAEPLPAGLKDQVLAAAVVTRQEPPAEAAAGDAARPERTRLARWFGSLAWPGRLAVTGAAAVTAAVLVLAVVFGVSAGHMRQQLEAAQAGGQQIATVMTAPDAVMMNGQVTGGGNATIVMSSVRHALVFTAQGLHQLPAARGYELWLVGPAGTRPVGMLPAGAGGMAGPVIASGLRQGDHLALTAEPASGSGRPTAPMMLDVTL
jgi:anti-sigma-K factor RskA